MKRKIGAGMLILLFAFLVIYSFRFKGESPQGNEKTSDSMFNTAVKTASADSSGKGTYPNIRDEFTSSPGNNPNMVALLEQLKSESPGVAGWLVGFANSEKVIFYNHAHMIAYSLKERNFYGAIDLMKIDANHIQGSEVTVFSFSPQGDYVVINNGAALGDNDSNWSAKMYLGDVRTGYVQEIGEANHFRIKDAWSPSTQFYAFADQKGDKVTVYDRATGEKRVVRFGQGRVKKIRVSDQGDVLIEGDQIYRLSRNNGYRVENLGLDGDLLALRGTDIVYFTGNFIRKYSLVDKKNMVLRDMGEGLQVLWVNPEQAILTKAGGKSSVVYNIGANSIAEYNYTLDSFPELLDWSFSPDSKYCVVLDGKSYRVIEESGNTDEINVQTDWELSHHNGWIDNSTFVAVPVTENPDFRAGYFQVVAYDLKAKHEMILYEQ